MEIPLEIENNLYCPTTVDCWVSVWNQVCKMAYEGKDIHESIVTRPGNMCINEYLVHDKRESIHSYEYSLHFPLNSYQMTLDNVWKQYSEFYGPENPKIIPQFKELVVPRALFESLGISQWFHYTFPNCTVTFWEE